jgi:hypothetical protein
MSLAVNGPEKWKTRELGACPCERSMWKLEPFQI